MGKKIALVLLMTILPVIAIFIVIISLIMSVITIISSEQSSLGKTCQTVSIINTENYKYDQENVLFDDYLAGVIAAESNGSNNLEYLKVLFEK